MKGKVRSVIYSHPDRAGWMSEAREEGFKILRLAPFELTTCAVQQNCSIKHLCIMCGIKIEMMCQKNTNVCSELCRKDRDGDHGRQGAIIEAPIGGER